MKIKSIKQAKNLTGRRVLLRVDFNAPLSNDFGISAAGDYRLRRGLPTIKYLIRRKAKIIILTHRGRPAGRVVEDLRLDPVAARLSQLLKKCVYKSNGLVDAATIAAAAALKNGEILMLENLRFDRREERGDQKFARQLSRLGDVYVNDAFAVSHRAHTSVAALADLLPAYAGLLLEEEIANLSRVLYRPGRPLTVIIGGAKISTKIKVIQQFLDQADNVLLGGALANTVLKAMGVAVGKSLVEPKMLPVIKKIKLTDNKLRVPVDGWLAKSYAAKTGRLDALADVHQDELILDVGPDTIKLYERIIRSSKLVVWNGPMGLVETPFFARGTEELIRILARARAYTIVGGGESVQVIQTLGLEKRFNFISTGGGAMLEFLEGKKLPGLARLLVGQPPPK